MYFQNSRSNPNFTKRLQVYNRLNFPIQNMEKYNCCDAKNDAYADISGTDDKDEDCKFTQQLINECKDLIPKKSIKSSGDADPITLLYEDMLDELELSNLFVDTNDAMDTNKLTTSVGSSCEHNHILHQLNKKIAQNLVQRRDLEVKAKATLAEKLHLERELKEVLQLINSHTDQECAARESIYRFGIPYFRNYNKAARHYTPWPNSDTREIIRNDEIMIIRLPRFKRLTPNRKYKLEAAVLKQLKIERIRRLQAALAAENNILTRKQKNDLQQEIKHAQSVRTLQSTKDWNIPVDFSRLIFPKYAGAFNCKFNEDECERIWQLVGDPRISKEVFSAQEANRLEQLTREYGAQDWDRIASMLNTSGGCGRSAFVCFVKWAQLRQKLADPRVWSKEESDRLASLCRKLENTKERALITDMWRYIRRQFPHRTYAQLNYRWLYVLKPSLKKGRFTKKEINVLNHLKNEGKSYGEIASIMQTRSSVQLRTHYDARSSRPLFNHGLWTNEEETKLASLICRYGAGNWTKISQELGTRSRVQCRLKARTLNYCNNDWKWSVSEKTLFRALLEKWKDNFELISRKLGTRSVAHCRRMYLRMKRRGEIKEIKSTNRWSDEETKLLRTLVGKGKCDFKAVSRELGTKSAKQCRYKYEKMRSRNTGSLRQKTGLWSSEETELLLTLVNTGKRNFGAISREMGTRNTEQCRSKYKRMVENGQTGLGKMHTGSSRQKTGLWSSEETELFRTLVNTRKRNFEAISREMGTRNIEQCRSKYRRMVEDGQIVPWNTELESPRGKGKKSTSSISRVSTNRWSKKRRR